MPSTSVMLISLCAPRAIASSPAAVSALMFRSLPLRSMASGEMTGMNWLSSRVWRRAGRILLSPRHARDQLFLRLSTLTFCRSIFLAMMRLASFPEIPTAPPARETRDTIFEFILPTRTIWATSRVSSSVYPKPEETGLFPMAFIFSVISGPPP